MIENNLSELPRGWLRTSLGEICIRITKGSTPTSYGYTYKKDGIKFIKTENIAENGNVGNINDFIDGATNLFLKRSILELNDILFSIAGTIGRVGYIQEKDLPANTNQALGITRCPRDFISNKYIFHFLKSPFIQKRAVDSIVGVGRANISLTNLGEFVIPLPPFPEQHRIVAKIDELFTKLDAGIESLKKVKAELKRYRQAVLKYAFEGKLTQEWREANKGKIEPASFLLERVKEERKKNAKGKYKEFSPIDTSKLPELPEGWVWTRIGEIARMIQYGTSEKAGDDSTGVPVIRMGNIYDGKIIFGNLKYFPKGWSQVNDFILRGGDILFNRTNSMELVGKTAVYKDNYPQAVFASYLIRVRVNNHFYIPEMISFFINSFYGKRYIASVVSQQVGQANVNGTKLSLMPIPLLSLSEQQKIVEEIESRLSIADNLEKVAEQSLKQSDRLRQGILKRAFEGKLVPQDPTDEPAEKLLERIKEEKTKREAENKKEKKYKSKNQKQMELI